MEFEALCFKEHEGNVLGNREIYSSFFNKTKDIVQIKMF